MSGKTWLVTGGAGFIGSNLVAFLIQKRKEKVRVLDNFSTGYLSNLENVKDSPLFELLEGDIRDEAACEKACDGVDYVVHLAALGSIPRSIDNPLQTHAVNVTGFINMLYAAKESGIQRFIYASSSSVYGDDASEIKIESRTGHPLSPYAVTKVANELYAEVFFKTYGLKTTGLRFFNVFGPQQNINGPYAAVIPIFVGNLLKKEPCRIFGDGTNTRDFTFIENVIDGITKAAFTDSAKMVGKVFNIACGTSISVKDLYVLIAQRLGATEQPLFAPPRMGDIKNSLADISAAIENFGYAPIVSVEDGVKITVDWYKENLSR